MEALIIGPASKSLGKKLADEVGLDAIPVESKVFPDGETYIRIPKTNLPEKCIIIQSTNPPQDRHLVEFFLILDAAKDLGAKDVVGIIPYLAYSRQDKRFLPGEAVSVKTIVRLIEGTGIKQFYTFNLHKAEILNEFSIQSYNLSAIPSIGEYLLKMDLKNPLVISPDKGALNLAQSLAESLDTGFSFFDKERDKVSGRISTRRRTVEAESRDVVIVDDLISTGSTIANVAKIVKHQGAERVIATCVHPILAEGALKKMRESGVDHLIGTDSVESEVSKVTVAHELARVLRKNM